MELVIWFIIALFVIIYRKNDGTETFYNFFKLQFGKVYEKYAPYSFQTISAKMKDLKQNYTMKFYYGSCLWWDCNSFCSLLSLA